ARPYPPYRRGSRRRGPARDPRAPAGPAPVRTGTVRGGGMTKSHFNFDDPAFVANYVQKGPPAFVPGHSGLLQLAGILLAERAPADGHILVVGAGGGLDTRAFATAQPGWRFTGVDPAAKMLDL